MTLQSHEHGEGSVSSRIFIYWLYYTHLSHCLVLHDLVFYVHIHMYDDVRMYSATTKFFPLQVGPYFDMQRVNTILTTFTLVKVKGLNCTLMSISLFLGKKTGNRSNESNADFFSEKLKFIILCWK